MRGGENQHCTNDYFRAGMSHILDDRVTKDDNFFNKKSKCDIVDIIE